MTGNWTSMLAGGIFGLGYWEILLVLLVVLLLFGGKKLPELARGMGRGLRIFKEEVGGAKKQFHDALENEDSPPKPDSDKASTGSLPPPPADEQRRE